MLVFNGFSFDSRVEREAATLVQAGFDVTVLALRLDGLPARENRQGVLVKRVGCLLSLRSALRNDVNRLPLSLRAMTLPFLWLYHAFRWLFEILTAALRAVRRFVRRRLLPAQSRVREGNWLRRMLWTTADAAGRLYAHAKRNAKRFVPHVERLLRQQAINLVAARLTLAAIAEHADVYHANDMNTLIPAFVASRLAGARLVYDSHELWSERNVAGGLTDHEKAAIRRTEGFLIRRVDATITVCRSIAVELSDMYGVPEPYVVRNTPAIAGGLGWHGRAGYIPRHGDRKILLYLGRIASHRGIEPMIEAIRGIDDVSVVIVGNGKERQIDRILRFAEHLQVAERVHLLAAVPHSAVTAIAAQADVGMVLFQNICRSYYYSLPTKLFECIHAGLPVIASDFPEMASLVHQYDIGVTCDPADPTAIAAAIRDILADPTRYQRLKENTRTAARELNWEIEGQKLVEIYREVIAK